MCIPGLDPLTLSLLAGAASTAASVGGGLMQRNNANQNALRAQQANNQVLAQYQRQMAEYDKKNRETLGGVLDKYAPEAQGQAIAAAADTRNAATMANAPVAENLTSSSATASAPTVVQDAITRALSEGASASADQSAARARSAAFGDSWLGNTFENQNVARDIGVNNAFARQDTALLPYQQQWATIASQKPDNGIGGILQGLGSLGGAYAGAGMPGLPGVVNPGTVGNTLGATYSKYGTLGGLY